LANYINIKPLSVVIVWYDTIMVVMTTTQWSG